MSVHDFSALSLTGEPVSLGNFSGKALLIVNTASQCGYTPQYSGLEQLFRQFRERGLEVLAFPCNQFRHQEPGTDAQIGIFCKKNYGVSFPLFAKVDVNGPTAHPLFKHLKIAAPGVLGTTAIKWNFTKFLVDKNGKVLRRYAPYTKPEQLIPDIEKLLA